MLEKNGVFVFPKDSKLSIDYVEPSFTKTIDEIEKEMERGEKFSLKDVLAESDV